jgi:D-3-phosphoglycerate dehydrogenase
MFELRSVLISDDVDDRCIEILATNGIAAVKKTKLTCEELKQELTKHDGLIVRSATKVTSDVIKAAGSRLKIIGRAGTGVDNVDVATATSQGIVVMNTPGGNTLSAAEHTCAMILAASRHVSRGTACVRDGLWEQKKFLIGNEVFGKTLAIVGLGRIGKEVATRMQAFGMTTIGYDPLVTADESLEFGVKAMSLDELWPLADYITLHTPLIPQTHHLVNATTLAKCKRGVRIINCARGGLVNEDDLLSALQSGQCAAAGLDVFEQEPPCANSPLLQHPLVTSTPHLGASTVEAQSRVAIDIAQQFVDFSRQRSLVGLINGRALSLVMDATAKPWLQLATTLGKLGRHLLDQNLAENDTLVTITAQGAKLQSDAAAEALSASLLVELLPRHGSDTFNVINSPAFAKSIGIKVKTTIEEIKGSEGNDDDDAGQQLVSAAGTLTVTINIPPRTGKTGVNLTVVGSLVGGQPHWLAVNGYQFWQPVHLVGHVIVCQCNTCCSPATLLTSISDTIGSQSKMPSVLSLVTSLPAAAAEDATGAVWCVVHVSASIGARVLTQPPSCTLLTHIDF